MPSIPQSLLWISLVVLWLFVLVPMLISKRDAVRRTSDVALATRVLNTGRGARLLKRARARRPGTAAIRTGDRPRTISTTNFDEDDTHDDESTGSAAEVGASLAAPVDRRRPNPTTSTSTSSTRTRAHLPVGESAHEEPWTTPKTDELTLKFEEPTSARGERRAPRAYEIATDEYEDDEPDGTDDEYEYVDDSSGLEAPAETDLQVADSMSAARRRRYDPTKAAAISARKYKFRKRMLAFMTLVTARRRPRRRSPWRRSAWWVCGGTGAVTLLYLGYLRRQTRIEERVRRRRAQRMARVAARRGEHRRPRVRRGPVAAAAARVGGAGDRRRGPDLRAPRLRAVRPRIRPAAARPASSRRRRPVSAAARSTGSLLPIRGYGAVGSATRSHRVGQGFESP